MYNYSYNIVKINQWKYVHEFTASNEHAHHKLTINSCLSCEKVSEGTNTPIIVCNNPGLVAGTLYQVMKGDHQWISGCRNTSSDWTRTILMGKFNNIKIWIICCSWIKYRSLNMLYNYEKVMISTEKNNKQDRD